MSHEAGGFTVIPPSEKKAGPGTAAKRRLPLRTVILRPRTSTRETLALLVEVSI